jgi:hypothetical protein
MNMVKVFIISVLILIGVNILRVTNSSASTAQTSPPSQTPPAPVKKESSPQNISNNWSGYAATNGTFTGVSGTWTVPVVSGTGNFGTDATWVGVGGVISRDLIQAGTIGMDSSGTVSYRVFFETLPDSTLTVDLAVNGGDSITVTLKQQVSTVWQIVIRDNTTGQSVAFTDNYNSSLSSAEWIQEAPSGVRRILPLNDFSTFQFTNGSTIENGKNVTIAGAKATTITLVGSSGQVLAAPSALGSDGASFSISRVNSSNS